MYFEDVDLCKRAADNGLSRILLNQWECLHYHGVSSRGDNKTKILTKKEVIKSHHKYIEKNFVGKNRNLAHRWLMIQKITELTVLGAFDKTKKAMLKKLKPFWHQMFSSTDI
jgi:GT2 family glycosyltransferase